MGMHVGRAASGRPAPQMNVTPLVDVVLVLLIIFMVVTPLLSKKFWLHVPKEPEEFEQAAPPPSEPPIVITYGTDDVIRINSQAVPQAELAGRIERLVAARRDGLVFFDADDGVDYGRALELMDLARGAGAATIAIAPQPIGR